MPLEIDIAASGVSANDLQLLLERDAGMPADVCRWQVRQPKRVMRMDAVAIITAVITSGAVTALIGGLLKIIEARTGHEGRIVITSRNGTTIDVPGDCSVQKLEEISKVIEGLEQPRVQLTL